MKEAGAVPFMGGVFMAELQRDWAREATASFYWLPGTAASAARMYWENSKIDFTATAVIDFPVGCSIFPKEIYPAPPSWANLAYRNLIHWNELDRGGHFAAFEQPGLFVKEIRSCFRKLRVDRKEKCGQRRIASCGSV